MSKTLEKTNYKRDPENRQKRYKQTTLIRKPLKMQKCNRNEKITSFMENEKKKTEQK